MFAVNELSQMELAEKAAKLGVEIFVLDDGWFGARDSEYAGLGDWTHRRGGRGRCGEMGIAK